MKFEKGDRVVSTSRDYRPGEIGIITRGDMDFPSRRIIYIVRLNRYAIARAFYEEELDLLPNGVEEMIKCL